MGEQLEGEEAVSQPASADEQRFFFGHVLHEWIKPIVLPIVVAYLTVRLVTPSGDEHDIALSVIRSNNGTKEITSAPDPFSDPFGLTGVIVVATAAPATQFTYTVVVTNSGDYPEDDVQTAISFQGDEGVYQVMSGPEIDASSGLLRDTVSLLSATPEH